MQTVTIIPKCNSSFLPTIGFAVAPSGLIYAEDTCSQGSEVGPLTHFIRATEQLSHDSNSQAVLICNKSELLTQRWKVLYPITNPLSETLLVCLENIDKYKQRNKQEFINTKVASLLIFCYAPNLGNHIYHCHQQTFWTLGPCKKPIKKHRLKQYSLFFILTSLIEHKNSHTRFPWGKKRKWSISCSPLWIHLCK